MAAAVSAGTFLHHIQIRSSDPARMAEFYAQAMDMAAQKVGEDFK